MFATKKIVTAAALLVAAAGAAHAADLPARVAPAPYVAPLPVFTWTGAYFGINAGAAFDNREKFTTNNNTTVLGSGDAAAQVAKLKQEVDGTIQVPGSNRLVHELIESDLVDQVNLMIFPVVLGTGKRVFGETTDKRPMRLKESRPVGDDGVVVMVYERAR